MSPTEKTASIFYADDSGFASTDRENNTTDELYFIGIIDILTPYGLGKKIEHIFKSLKTSEVIYIKHICLYRITIYRVVFLQLIHWLTEEDLLISLKKLF